MCLAPSANWISNGRSESQIVGFQGARNMLSSNSDSMDSCMSAAQDSQAPLDEGGNLVLNDTQVSDPMFQNQIPCIDQSRIMSE